MHVQYSFEIHRDGGGGGGCPSIEASDYFLAG